MPVCVCDTVVAMRTRLLIARKVVLFVVRSDVCVVSIVRIEVVEEVGTRVCHCYW